LLKDFETTVEELPDSKFVLKSVELDGIFGGNELLEIQDIGVGFVYKFPTYHSFGIGKVGSFDYSEAEELYKLLGHILTKEGYV
jgi:hypothetical protein